MSNHLSLQIIEHKKDQDVAVANLGPVLLIKARF
jgi:hypothetical protein